MTCPETILGAFNALNALNVFMYTETRHFTCIASVTDQNIYFYLCKALYCRQYKVVQVNSYLLSKGGFWVDTLRMDHAIVAHTIDRFMNRIPFQIYV